MPDARNASQEAVRRSGLFFLETAKISLRILSTRRSLTESDSEPRPTNPSHTGTLAAFVIAILVRTGTVALDHDAVSVRMLSER